MKIKHFVIVLITFFLIFFSNLSLFSQVPFSTYPEWISLDVSNYSTGAAFADINQDGWIDLVIANGNDMARQRVAVYLNNGTGNYPGNPSWQSSDIDYHGHLDVGDVNADGYPDVAVSVYLGASGFGQKGKVKLYLNNAGTLSSTPDWVSYDSVYTFSCAFGDADGDGDLDLAVAGGESYSNRPEHLRIYYNNGVMLDSLPGWMSQSTVYSYDVNWADFDNDGDMDLVFANEEYPNQIYENLGDSICTNPAWQSTDPAKNANSLFVGDLNNDGFIDLAISDNNQFGGSGKFKLYQNNQGSMATTPFWSSGWSGRGSGIMMADIDNDNDMDLLTGGWWQPCRIYLNNNGNFSTNPEYTSNTNSVVEAIICGDYDNDAINTITNNNIGNGVKKLFYLPRTPLQKVITVIVDGDTLTLNQYCYDLECGWISLATAPDSGKLISFKVIESWDLDMAISNWDPSKGNYLFINHSVSGIITKQNILPEGFELYQNYPNPFNPATTIRFTISPRGQADLRFTILKVYDVLGNEIATLVNEKLSAGSYETEWNGSGYPSGVYFYKLVTMTNGRQADDFVDTKKMLLIK